MGYISINRINIQLKEVSPQVAHLLAAGLGREILARLSEEERVWRAEGRFHTGYLGLGPVCQARGVGPSELQQQIASAIARTIADAVSKPSAPLPSADRASTASDTGESNRNV